MRRVSRTPTSTVTISLAGFPLLLASLFILAFGKLITDYLPGLQRLNIPVPVIGGLICSVLLSGVGFYAPIQFDFGLAIRDVCLLLFFGALGFTARTSQLRNGGRSLIMLFGITVVFLVLQNATGVLVAYLLQQPLIYGLLAGTIAFAGGHATAITWGAIIETRGLADAMEFGSAAATLGLILGGLLGGPIAHRLIQKHQLQIEVSDVIPNPLDDIAGGDASSDTLGTQLGSLFLLALALSLGLGVQAILQNWGVTIPSFLPVLMTAALLTNLVDALGIDVNRAVLDRIGDVTLQLFLVMSLMSLQWLTLIHSAGPLIAILMAQGILMVLFASFIVFPLVGRNYDASVLCAGFTGLGLGATPIGIANMQAITGQYGAAPKAFLLIPLMGVFCLDITNSVIIQSCLQFPFLSFP